MDAVAAVDAFFIVNDAKPVFVVMDRVHRAGLFARAFQMHDGAKGAGLRTLPAGFTFFGINVHLCGARMDRVKFTAVQTGFAQTETTAISHHIILDRAVIAGNWDHIHHIMRRIHDVWVLSHSQSDPCPNDLSLFKDAAAVLGLGARADTINQLFLKVLCNLSLPGSAAHLPENMMLQIDNALIIRDQVHVVPPKVNGL